ncbi:hypothetical protein C8F01DRAFT_1137021 [Mycena amicta]|nr:hypothetical protein C8F01DRAFT_1137021 [Mycena amicta]
MIWILAVSFEFLLPVCNGIHLYASRLQPQKKEPKITVENSLQTQVTETSSSALQGAAKGRRESRSSGVIRVTGKIMSLGDGRNDANTSSLL